MQEHNCIDVLKSRLNDKQAEMDQLRKDMLESEQNYSNLKTKSRFDLGNISCKNGHKLVGFRSNTTYCRGCGLTFAKTDFALCSAKCFEQYVCSSCVTCPQRSHLLMAAKGPTSCHQCTQLVNECLRCE